MEVIRMPRRYGDFIAMSFLRNWWDNDSSSLQDGVFYLLCAAYCLVGSFALIQLFRIQKRASEYGWTTQKVFHFMNLIMSAARAVVFAFYKDVFTFKIRVLSVILLEFPGLLFFSTYTLLVLFWAEIYHQARSMPTEKLRPGFITINSAVYSIQILIWLSEWISYNAATQAIMKLFFAAVSFSAALGFALFGGRLFLMLQRFPSDARGREKKLREIGFITAICFTCFIIRTVVVAISAFNEEADPQVLGHPLLDLSYFMVVEILPSSLVLFILRKLPPRKRPPGPHDPVR